MSFFSAYFAAMQGVLDLAFAAMALDGGAFRAIASDPGNEALILLLLAGSLSSLSQALVLLVNQVPPGRFALAIVLNALLFAASVAFLSANVSLAGALLSTGWHPGAVFRIIALAHAPWLLAPFTIIPHFGLLWHKLLEAWVLVCVVAGLALGLGLEFPYAAALGLIGWMFSRGLVLLAGPALNALPGRLRDAVAGRPLVLDRNVAIALRLEAEQAHPPR